MNDPLLPLLADLSSRVGAVEAKVDTVLLVLRDNHTKVASLEGFRSKLLGAAMVISVAVSAAVAFLKELVK